MIRWCCVISVMSCWLFDVHVCFMFQSILCLSYLLASLERPTWSNEYTLHVFRSLMPFVTSSKAKVCSEQLSSVISVLMHS